VARSRERAGLNRLLFREVNERIVKLMGSTMDSSVLLFICECSNDDCAETVEVALDEYESVRSHPDRFVVAPAHENEEIERVVTRSSRFVVVEKLGGGKTTPAEGDPRQL
jgi:hypothetical protein